MKKTDRPWHVPVPVRRSDFQSLYARHAKFNIQTDLGSIRPFGLVTRRELKGISVAQADLQSNSDINVLGRLGSGRSVFYLGAYLKGVGRTTLAANWSTPSEAYHNSGHLMASAAIREFAVTSWLKACGAQNLIVPCEGLLFKPVEASLRNFFPDMARMMHKKNIANPAVDDHFQAISVKSANFCRFSNLHWLLNHVTAATVPSFFEILDASLPGSGSAPLALAKRFEKSVMATLENFFRFIEYGVHWSSLDNNFTVDGRFLDLEVPIITGDPGLDFKSPASPFEPRAMFLEPLGYRRQIRGTINLLTSQIQNIADRNFTMSQLQLTERERRRVGDFLQALSAQFPDDHPIRSTASFTRLFVERMASIFQLGPSARKVLRDLIRHSLEPDAEFNRTLIFEKTPYSLVRPEPAQDYAIWKLQGLEGPQRRNLAVTNRINELILGLESETNLPRLFLNLKKLPTQMRTIQSIRPR